MICSSTNPLEHKLSEIEQSIIRTLIYYESQGELPATIVELYRYLQKNKTQLLKTPNLIKVLGALKNLVKKGFLCQKGGLFFLKNGLASCKKRVSRQKNSIKKWKKLQRIAPFMSVVPYLRGLMISGSLIFDNTRKESDIDLLVITKKGRIWTCRLWLSFFLEIIGQRRSIRFVRDRICLNHYLAEPYFTIEPQNLITAQFYAHLIPLIDYGSYQKLYEKNQWVQSLFFNGFFCRQNHQKMISKKSLMLGFYRLTAKFSEWLLNNSFGDWLEKQLANYQLTRIKRKIADKHLTKDQLYLSNKALLFHYPICRYEQVKKAFLNRIRTTGLGPDIIDK